MKMPPLAASIGSDHHGRSPLIAVLSARIVTLQAFCVPASCLHLFLPSGTCKHQLLAARAGSKRRLLLMLLSIGSICKRATSSAWSSALQRSTCSFAVQQLPRCLPLHLPPTRNPTRWRIMQSACRQCRFGRAAAHRLPTPEWTHPLLLRTSRPAVCTNRASAGHHWPDRHCTVLTVGSTAATRQCQLHVQ